MAFIINRGKKKGIFYIPSGGTVSPTPPAPSFSSTKSLDFDGVDDYVETPAVFSLLDGLTNFAFSFWFKTSSFSYKQLFWIDGSSATANYAQTQLAVRPNYLIWYFNNNSYYVYANNNLVADTWYHALCTRDASRATGDKARIYINGVNESLNDSSVGLTTLETSTSGLKIGDGDFRGNYSGNIDEFAVYNQDMAAYIDEIYNSGTPDDLSALATAPAPNDWFRMGENSTFSSPQILMPENTNKDKASNYSMAFDGINDIMNVTYDISLSVAAGNHTLSYWIKTTSTALQVVTEKGSSGELVSWVFSSKLYWGGVNAFSSATNINDGNWKHICLISDGAASYIYINGVLDATGGDKRDLTPNFAGFAIGARAASSYPLNGNLDEISLFNSAKSIGDLWDGTGKPTDLTGESGLVSWWRMGEKATFSTVWTVPDQIGSNTGTSANMTIEDRVGDAPDSSNNALSYNMVEADIEEEAP